MNPTPTPSEAYDLDADIVALISASCRGAKRETLIRELRLLSAQLLPIPYYARQLSTPGGANFLLGYRFHTALAPVV